MSPARAAPGWSPPRAVLAGRDAPARVRARAVLRGARQALVEAEVGRLRAESSRAADDADAQLRLAPGQPQGQPHPTYSARGVPARALPARGRPATSPRPARPRQGRGAHMYRGNPSGRLLEKLTLQRGGANNRPPSHRGAARPGQFTALRDAVVQRPHIRQKEAAPAAPQRETARGGPGRRHSKDARGRARATPRCRSCPRAWRSSMLENRAMSP